MTIKYLSAIIFVSLFFGVVSNLFFKIISRKFKILMHEGIPLTGGAGLTVSFLISTLLGCYFFNIWEKEIIGVLISSFILFIFGMIDDRHELSIASKIITQIIAVAVLIFCGVSTHIVYIGTMANFIITFIWIIGITNAVNHLDIMDGLAGLVSFIITSVFFIIALQRGYTDIIILTLALGGAIFSLLLFNLPPAKIYMGNSGSHFLGFVLAAIALEISYAPLDRPVALLSKILILGFPILDTLFLIIMRLKKKISPVMKSNDHLALRFLKLGYSKNKTLTVMALLTLFFSLSGLILNKVSNLSGITIVLIVLLTSIGLLIKMSKLEVNG